MKNIILALVYLSLIHWALAQEIIEVPHEKTESTTWKVDETTYFSEIWQTNVVTNVSAPTMEVFRPENANGTSVIVAPGGGLYALSISSEGTDVARSLNEKGITAFVLKYRLVPTGKDGVQEYTNDSAQNDSIIERHVMPILPYSYADALSAIAYVRENAANFNIDPQKIGFMGFSAGGAVAMGVAYNYTADNRPDFLVPVYAWTRVMSVQEVPEDAPPMFVVCASDDPLGLAPGSIELYASWQKAKKPVALHMYAKGGHGFGMRKQDLPSDTWIERFHDWSIAQGLTK